MSGIRLVSGIREINGSRPTTRVVAVPASHPYVQRMAADQDVVVLPDPLREGASPGQWWPPVALDPEWIVDHADDADLLHIHFGTESFTVDWLRRTVDAARSVGWPVVFTLHDIDHPQLTDQSGYHAQLDFLVREADAVITLTPGAAAHARRRWNRPVTIIPHPRILADGLPLHEPNARDYALIGVHLKDLRPNTDAAAIVTTTIDAVRRLNRGGTPARARIWMHTTVRDPRTAELVRSAVLGAEFAELVEHDRFTDVELANRLSTLDVCVLPYGHGTHSGWLELCWDLGVAVAAPDIGFYRDQHDDGSVGSFVRGSADSLAATIERLIDPRNPLTARAGTAEREALRITRHDARIFSDAAAARQQRELYRSLLEKDLTAATNSAATTSGE